jgi:hypothetical protein
MTQVIVNGNTYSDDGSTPKDMQAGGFRTHLLPMVSDTMVDTAAKVAAAAHQVELAEDAAAAAAVSASTAVSGPGSNGTSTTSLTVGLGAQSLTIQTGKTLSPGMPCTIASTASPRNWMNGSIDSYNSGTGALQVYVTNIGLVTPGTFPTLSAWTVSLSGPAAQTGVLNEQKGGAIASASTVNLDTATGNYLHLTGSVTVTAVTLAQGAEREITLDAAPLFTNGANLILPTGANVQGAAGDVVVFRGEGSSVVRVTSWTRANGQALAVAAQPSFRVSRSLTSSGTFTAPTTGWLRITHSGASGNGGAALGSTGVHSVAASGGATGGLCVKTVWAQAGDVFTATLAAGGTAISISAPGTVQQGNAGGNSSVTGPGGLNMVANGGQGGKATIVTSGAAVAAAAVGGTASGGDLNFSGGGSGIATSGTALSSMAATGGGAIPWGGVGYSSGAATAANSSFSMAATGGAGVGGGSGSATGASAVSAGGGSASASAASITTSGTPGAAEITNSTPLLLNGQGGGTGSAVSSGAGGNGAGSGAAYYPSMSSSSISSGTGGVLAGTGGVVGYGASGSLTASVSTLGGAVGGVAMSTTSTGTVAVSAGANAVAIFEWN